MSGRLDALNFSAAIGVIVVCPWVIRGGMDCMNMAMMLPGKVRVAQRHRSAADLCDNDRANEMAELNTMISPASGPESVPAVRPLD